MSTIIGWVLETVNPTYFLNAFWLFLGVVAGALVQYFLASLSLRKQARTGLKIMQIEIAYNRSEVVSFLEYVRQLKERIQANQLADEEMYFPMYKFDYSSIAPLVNSGYFHVLLGPERLKQYLEFHYFFRTENGNFLSEMLKKEHQKGKSIDFLNYVENRARVLSHHLEAIENGRLAFGKLVTTPEKSKGKLPASHNL